MTNNVHIKNVNANEAELSEMISEIYVRKITKIKNTQILEYIEDTQIDNLLKMKDYFEQKQQTILITINGL